MSSLSPTYHALLREAAFTKQMLGAGATYIYAANYALHGMYFQAFSSLSVGLERLGKLCVMIDYAIDNNGVFPTNAQMKSVGHDLMVLYSRSQSIKASKGLNFKFLQDLSDPIQVAILQTLSSFAKGDRYANIDLLARSQQSKDPIEAWARLVDAALYRDKISSKKKASIEERARQSSAMDDCSFVFHTAEDGTPIVSYGDAALRALKHGAVAPYRQLFVLQIIRYWVELLCDLEMPAHQVMPNDVPSFNEILGPFCNSDAYIRTRKTWNKD